ncbi:uncharacterized protein LOC108161574 [Drosophila miranda]|uniref:uncharacterized protein LOC108161574 n=1 Tax=Drosophila miranda TaxID=7229 RepID=UPI0007E78E30|nr:uncharacterized protein LOC108161574 [Drosophila miranda]
MGQKSKPVFKFPMHDTHLNKSLRNLKVACVLALVAPICLYVLHNEPRKAKYKTFYSHYDPMDAFERMMSGGYLSSCPPGSGGKKDKDSKDKKK